MVKPGTNQVARRPEDLSKARIRRAPTRPNSPRESGVGVVMPRAMKPDWVSKSNVRHTMWRGNCSSAAGFVAWVERKRNPGMLPDCAERNPGYELRLIVKSCG